MLLRLSGFSQQKDPVESPAVGGGLNHSPQQVPSCAEGRPLLFRCGLEWDCNVSYLTTCGNLFGQLGVDSHWITPCVENTWPGFTVLRF